MLLLNLYIAISGIAFTYLATKRKPICNYILLTHILAFAVFSYLNGVYGDMLMNLCISLPMALISIFHWNTHRDEENLVIIRKLDIKGKVVTLLIFLIYIPIAYYILSLIQEKAVLLNVIAIGLSTLAYMLRSKGYIECWIVMIALVITNIILWLTVLSFTLIFAISLVKCLIYLVLNTKGLIGWTKEYKNRDITNKFEVEEMNQ